MAHTILHSDGFEHDALGYRYSSAEITGSTSTTNTSPAFGYGRALVISGDENNYMSPYLSSSPYTTLYTAFHHRTTTNSTTEAALVTFRDDLNGARQITITIQYNGSSGQIIRARRGTSTDTLLATSTANLPLAGTWAHVSVMVFVDQVNGRVKVNINSSTVIDFTGNTRNTAASRIDRIRIHGRVGGQSNVYDNWVIATGDPNADAPLPEIRIYTQFPSADDITQFSVSGAISNWAAVNEVPPNDDTNYTYSGTVGQQDTFVHTAPSIVSTVLGVRVNANLRRDDAGSREFVPVVKPATSSYTPASNQGMYNRYWIQGYAWQTNPDTGVTWTPVEAMNAKFGYKLAG